MKQQKPYVRIQQSWLAANERRLLVAVAESLPQWIKPDHLTLLGLGGSLLCCIGFVASALSSHWLWLVVLGLVLNWAGDSLDGNLARVRRTERPNYGFFVDHSSDIISQALVFIGMGLSPYVRFETGCLLLMSYWLASMFTFIRTISVQVFQISYFGIGPTEIRLGLIVYVLSLLTVGTLPVVTPVGVVSLMDILAVAIFAVVLGSFLAMTFRESRRLSALERTPAILRPAAAARPAGLALGLADRASP